MQALTRDEAAVLAGKEDETGCDLAGLTGSAHGGGERLLGVFVHGRWDEWCPYYYHVSVAASKYEMSSAKLTGTRADTVDTYAVPDLLI